MLIVYCYTLILQKETITNEFPNENIGGEIEILDVSGKVMDKQKAVNKQTIDISSYPKGIYFVRSKYHTQKLIKQ